MNGFEETGVLALDIVLGGGFRRGNMYEVAGPSGCGKTTVLQTLVRNAVKLNEWVVFIDAEKGVDKSVWENLKITDKVTHDVKEHGNDKPLLHLRKESHVIGKVEELLDKKIEEGKTTHFILDSIASLVPSQYLKGSVEDVAKQPGLDARLREVFLRKYHALLGDEEDSVLWLINHTSTDFGGGGGFGGMSPTKSAGGKGVEYYCDRRVKMTSGSKITRRENTINGLEEVKYGAVPKIHTVKNRVARSHIYVPCPIIYGRGASNLLFMKDLLESKGFVMKSGGWRYLSKDDPKRGKDERDEKVNGDGELLKWVNDNYEELFKNLESLGCLDLAGGDFDEE